MVKILRLIFGCILALNIFVQRVSATEYVFFANNLPAIPGVSDAGHMTEVLMFYNSTTKRWRMSSKFLPDPVTNSLPSGYITVLSGGPMPMHQGQAATLYFDWTNVAQPVVTVYGYGSNGPTLSHIDGGEAAGVQAPDRIVSSLNTPGFVQSFSVTPYQTGIQVDFDIDLSIVLNHVPLYPSPNAMGWFQPAIGARIGLWHYPIAGAEFTYHTSGAAAGFVSNVTFKCMGNYDVTDLPFYSYPECSASSTEETVVRVGKPYTGSVLATDVGYNFTVEQLRVNYSGLPSGATVDPANDTLRTPPFTAAVSWTPSAADQGQSYTINVKVKDPVGLEAICPLRVRVPVNQPPVCSLAATASVQACGGGDTTVTFDGTLSVDPEGDPLFHTWDVVCSDPLAIVGPAIGLRRTATLKNPGLGIDSQCTVTLSVSDGVDTASCSATVSAPKCNLDCLGVPNGTAQRDQCGVCNGTNACLDCRGVPNGSARIDRCNVCDGDGTSCLGCSKEDVTETKFAMDSRAADQHQFNRQIGRALLRADPRAKRFVRELLQVSRALYNESWTVVWEGLPSILQQCTNTVLCSAVDNSAPLNRYTQNVNGLRAIAVQISDRLENRVGASKRIRNLRTRAAKLLQGSLAAAATVKPTEACS